MRVGEVKRIDEKDYRVVGIDSYSLNNVEGERREWKSITLQGSEERRWLVGPIFDRNWIFDAGDKKSFEEKLEVIPEYCGTADISFEGDRGFSSPKSLLLLFRKNDGLVGVEQFVGGKGPNIYYFVGKEYKE